VSAIEVVALSHHYPPPDGRGPGQLVLDHIDLRIERNEFVAVVGFSGCGKSTLLRCIAGLLQPTAGEVRIEGRPPQRARQDLEIGFVFQEPGLFPWRTVLENVLLPLEIRGRVSADDRIAALNLLDIVGLARYARHRPDQLSGGMRQRAAIVRALITRPKVLLLDEPFAALDQITRDALNEELLRVWADHQATVVFVTHSIPEALFLADRVVVLAHGPGRVCAQFPVPAERPRRRELKRTAAYLALETRILAAMEGVEIDERDLATLERDGLAGADPAHRG